MTRLLVEKKKRSKRKWEELIAIFMDCFKYMKSLLKRFFLYLKVKTKWFLWSWNVTRLPMILFRFAWWQWRWRWRCWQKKNKRDDSSSIKQTHDNENRFERFYGHGSWWRTTKIIVIGVFMFVSKSVSVGVEQWTLTKKSVTLRRKSCVKCGSGSSWNWVASVGAVVVWMCTPWL